MSDRTIDFTGARLDLGCGTHKVGPGYVGIDRAAYPGVDIVGDVHAELSKIPDGVVAEIFTAHFLEHIDELDEVLAQCARVLKPGGRFRIEVPHFSNPYFYSDPTHRRTFGLYSIGYYTRAVPFKRTVPVYGAALPLELVQVRLGFKSSPPFYGRHAVKQILERFVNAHRAAQEFYEEWLSSLLPCYELRFELVKVG